VWDAAIFFFQVVFAHLFQQATKKTLLCFKLALVGVDPRQESLFPCTTELGISPESDARVTFSEGLTVPAARRR
jgi:hypothetical protein